MSQHPSPEQKSKKRGKASGLRHKAAHDPRAAALSALHAVLYEGVDSQAALDTVLRSTELVPTDRRLCTELLYGVLRWYLRLDGLVRARLKNPDKLPLEMRLALLAALYELSALRIPAHATVNWTVQHVRNRFGSGLAGVANGVLRALQRERIQLLPQAPGAPVSPAMERENIRENDAAPLARPAAASWEDAELADLYAMPQWIVSMWREQYGPEAAREMLAASQQPAPVGVRLNMRRKGWEELLREVLDFAPQVQENPDAEDAGMPLLVSPASGKGKNHNFAYRAGACALAFSGSLPWMLREPVKDGRASRQSAASYEAFFAFDPQSWPTPLWDACAGRGGKSLALMEAGIPVALTSDPSSRRLSSLPEEFSRLFPDADVSMPALCAASAEELAAALGTGAAQDCMLPVSKEADASQAPAPVLPGQFGTILVDAPCSGLGTLARRPEIRLRRAPEDCEALAVLQKNILDAVWERLLPGGLLVYVTCTMNKAENQSQTAAFLERHSGAALEAEFETPAGSPLGEFFYSAKIRKRS